MRVSHRKKAEMDIKKCEVLLRSVDFGSFSKAAKELGYTPSGISHMMNALEDELGFQLLIRKRNGVIPTSDCEKIIPILRELVKWDEQLTQVTSQITGLETGTITIGTYSSMSVHWLPKIINEFQRDYPNIKIKMMEGVRQEIEGWMDENRIDICFYSYQPPMKHDWIPLKDDRMIAILPPDHPLAKGDSYPLSECENEKFIMPALGYDYDVVHLIEEANLSLNIHFSTMDNYAILSMIECGLGMSIMNELVTKGRNWNVVMLPLDDPKHITLGIALPSLSTASPASRRFIEYAKRVVAKL